MQEDIIQQIKEAEKQAEEQLKAAQAEANEIIHDARRQAVEARLKIIDAARAKAKERFAAGVKAFESELTHIRQTCQDEIAQDTERAQRNMPAVIDFVVATFRKHLGFENIQDKK